MLTEVISRSSSSSTPTCDGSRLCGLLGMPALAACPATGLVSLSSTTELEYFAELDLKRCLTSGGHRVMGMHVHGAGVPPSTAHVHPATTTTVYTTTTTFGWCLHFLASTTTTFLVYLLWVHPCLHYNYYYTLFGAALLGTDTVHGVGVPVLTAHCVPRWRFFFFTGYHTTSEFLEEFAGEWTTSTFYGEIYGDRSTCKER